MQELYPTQWPQFFTATILHWHPILSDNSNKIVITKSLKFLVENNRIELNAFVIMSNHIHLIWQPLPGFSLNQIQMSFLKFTAKELKACLIKNDSRVIENFKVKKFDRQYQIWKRESLSIELFTPWAFSQKLNYIHNNPVKAGLCKLPEEYYYSSAKFYYDGVDHFGMLTHHDGG